MLTLSQQVVFFVALSEFFLGTWINGFTGLMLCLTWVKSRKISLSDFIILNLSLSRIILQGILMFDTVLTMFYPHLQDVGTFMQIIDILWTFINNLSICLMTCLSVLYCLKIANFSHYVFLWLKWRVSRVVIWILLGSGFYSFFSIVALIVKFSDYSDLCQMKLSENCTEDDKRRKIEYYVIHILGALWSVIPFSVSLTSSVLLILSLIRHIQQMQHHDTGTRDLSTRAHVKATKVILSSLFLFIGYILILLLIMSSHFFPNSKLPGITVTLIFIAYASIQTFVLILENQKLKRAFLGMFQIKKWRLKC
ncbi:taste receptor type 2 member 3-like [Trichosurus vulpecula]|uniref:taste receptor type 2 member 3-like n=1 Tax=Trichosurus vulpecula TaxID=9337 RepID=UPI00186B16B6|nr:taste receptor type 2 member 3-like [Trichosurus vulpecula]